jgi:hypothetical protein
MAAEPKELHPAVQYLKDNAVVIGLVVVVIASVAFFAFTQSQQAKPAAVKDVPKPVATAALATGAPTPGATSPSGATGSATGSTGPSAGAGASQAAAQPSPTATPSEPVVLGKEAQGVSAKDWRTYARSFATAWVNTADGKEAWLGRLKPLVSADLYAGFVQTDIRTVPAVAIDTVSMGEESLAAKTFNAYSKSGPVFEGRVSVQADGSWLVDQIAPPKK